MFQGVPRVRASTAHIGHRVHCFQHVLDASVLAQRELGLDTDLKCFQTHLHLCRTQFKFLDDVFDKAQHHLEVMFRYTARVVQKKNYISLCSATFMSCN